MASEPYRRNYVPQEPAIYMGPPRKEQLSIPPDVLAKFSKPKPAVPTQKVSAPQKQRCAFARGPRPGSVASKALALLASEPSGMALLELGHALGFKPASRVQSFLRTLVGIVHIEGDTNASGLPNAGSVLIHPDHFKANL